MENEKLTLSYSQITSFLVCHKKWWWMYHEDLAPIAQKDRPLQVGDIVHTLLDAYYRKELKADHIEHLNEYIQQAYPENTKDDSLSIALEAAQLVYGYIKQFEEDELRVISPEMHLEKDYGDYKLYSRLDASCVTPDNRLWRMEHKTTSRVDNFYLSGLRKGLQTGIALKLCEDLVDSKIAGTIFNLLVKTKVPQYPRAPVPKERWVIDIATKTVEGVVRDIKHGDFYPSGQCVLYNRECEYLPLCRNDTPRTREAFYTSRKRLVEVSKARKLLTSNE